MTRAGSQALGQRAEHVSQVRQSQMVGSLSALARRSCTTRRMMLWGRRSESAAMGQPAEHLPHW